MAVGERLMTRFRPAGVARRKGYPEVTPAFTWAALVLGAWVLLGAAVDINAHNHGEVDESFFTPFHLLMYSGVAANGLFFVAVQFRNVGRGHTLMQALPREYLLSFAGALLFGLGGVFDLIWHEIFGFEAGIDALVSPSHLLLVVSGMMFMSGPLRSFLAEGKVKRGGWAQLFPPVTSVLMVFTLGTLFTLYTNVWTQLDRYVATDVGESLRMAQAYTVAGALIPAALLSGALLFLRQRMALPFGAVTWVLLANAALMLYIRFQWTSAYAIALLAPLGAGLLGDWLLARDGLSLAALRRFACLVPFVYMFSLFAILQLVEGMWWTPHMWLGVSVMSGAVGLGMSALVTKKELPLPA